jgi:tryptophan halogenase
MGFRTGVEPAALSGEAGLAVRAMRENRAQTEKLCSSLPRHRDLIDKIREYGLQPV